jgi:O-acetyl-ADP-ribose deacetylase (regulator of RNase III)
LEIIKGDLIEMASEGKISGVIVHGCNCFNNMGVGFARQIKDYFFEAYLADQKTIKGDKKKLGRYSHVNTSRNGSKLTIINAYTQYHYGGVVRNADYKAIGEVFKSIAKDFPNEHIYYPLIGAGHARGDWSIISEIINRELDGMKHTCVIWDKEKK